MCQGDSECGPLLAAKTPWLSLWQSLSFLTGRDPGILLGATSASEGVLQVCCVVQRSAAQLQGFFWLLQQRRDDYKAHRLSNHDLSKYSLDGGLISSRRTARPKMSKEEHLTPCSGWHYSYSSNFCILYST
jgi:hypothetical protein